MRKRKIPEFSIPFKWNSFDMTCSLAGATDKFLSTRVATYPLAITSPCRIHSTMNRQRDNGINAWALACVFASPSERYLANLCHFPSPYPSLVLSVPFFHFTWMIKKRSTFLLHSLRDYTQRAWTFILFLLALLLLSCQTDTWSVLAIILYNRCATVLQFTRLNVSKVWVSRHYQERTK